jgi:hypothetical protein
MSDQNTTTAAVDQGTQAQAQAPSANGTDDAPRLYPTKAEAESNKPTTGKKRLYEVAKDGTTRWGWCNGYDHALATAARNDGYSAALSGKAKEVTKEAVAAKVMEMSDDEFKALIAARKAAAKGQK